MQRVCDFRDWFERGQVICIANIDHNGVGYRHPVRPYTPGDYWDESVIRGLMRQGYVVVIVDYGWRYEVPSVYNDIPLPNIQLSLFEIA